MSNGTFDINAITNVRNANAAGIPRVDVYLSPCRNKSAESQVSDVVYLMNGESYGWIWLRIEDNPSPSCGWGTDYDSNCNYVWDLVDSVWKNERGVGIFSTY